MVADRLMIMNFNNECIGHVDREPNAFVEYLNGETKEYTTLPPIMRDIALEPSQFPLANEVLEYYNLDRYNVWEYFKRSNGIKTSRDVWFMAEPIGETWIPLVLGMQRYGTYGALCRIGDEFSVLMNGKMYVNRHTVDVFPSCIKPYLKRNGETRFSTAHGYVKDLADYPARRGVIGRIVVNFP